MSEARLQRTRDAYRETSGAVMTQAELEAIPIVDGLAVLLTPDDGGVVRDRAGAEWCIGIVAGRRVRRRFGSPAHSL